MPVCLLQPVMSPFKQCSQALWRCSQPTSCMVDGSAVWACIIPEDICIVPSLPRLALVEHMWGHRGSHEGGPAGLQKPCLRSQMSPGQTPLQGMSFGTDADADLLPAACGGHLPPGRSPSGSCAALLCGQSESLPSSGRCARHCILQAATCKPLFAGKPTLPVSTALCVTLTAAHMMKCPLCSQMLLPPLVPLAAGHRLRL